MNLTKKNILIVGGTGFVGFHLAKKCKLNQLSVTSFSISKPKKKRYLKGVKYVFGNIRNKKSLKKLNRLKFHFVVNCGGYVDHINKKKTYDSHYNGCVNLYEYFKDKNLLAFIQMGSSSEYGKEKSPLKESIMGNPKDIYGKSKLLASNFLLKKNLENGFPSIILRLFHVFGPFQDNNRFIPFVINECLKGKKFDCSDCTQKRDFLSIDDAIKAILLCMKEKKAIGQIINIGSGKTIILKNVIKDIIKTIKKGQPNFGKIKLRSDENKIIYPDIKKAKKILNWKLKDNFSYKLKETVNYYKGK